MKKIISLVCIFVLVVSLCSCRTPAKYKFMNDENEIQSVKIVEIFVDEQHKIVEKTIKVVNDTKVFMEKFNKLPCYVWYGDPIGINSDYVGNAIKIIYKNDEYELVIYNGRAEYTAEFGLSNYEGTRIFDEEQFNSLISDYLYNIHQSKFLSNRRSAEEAFDLFFDIWNEFQQRYPAWEELHWNEFFKFN